MKVLIWVLKTFWFPILVALLGFLGKKSEFANKAHTTLKKYK
jgi:hypothetical protein